MPSGGIAHQLKALFGAAGARGKSFNNQAAGTIELETTGLCWVTSIHFTAAAATNTITVRNADATNPQGQTEAAIFFEAAVINQAWDHDYSVPVGPFAGLEIITGGTNDFSVQYIRDPPQ